MSNRLISENQVKAALGINSFRNITKDTLMQFVSLIPNMDKDVAISILNQFPEYTKLASELISELKLSCDEALKYNDKSQNESIAAYKKILDDLGELLKKDELTPEERDRISDKMIFVADKIAKKDTENKVWIKEVIKNPYNVIYVALILGAIILGVNVKGSSIPILKK